MNLHTFSVLTLNVWGLLWVSKDRTWRMQGIAESLLAQTSPYDVIALQELWCQEDYEYLLSTLSSLYPHSLYSSSRKLGSGLAIFSRFPIIESEHFSFTINGKPEKILHGDWFTDKGVLYAKIAYPRDGQPVASPSADSQSRDAVRHIHFFTTHAIAQYDTVHDEYETHRTAQLLELRAFMDSKLSNAHCNDREVAILAGDLNTQPHELPYRLLTGRKWQAPVAAHEWTDLYRHMQPDQQGCTHGALGNTYTGHGYALPCQRIDYIMMNCVSTGQVPAQYHSFLEPLKVMTAIDGPHNNSRSLSDHAGVSALFAVKPYAYENPVGRTSTPKPSSFTPEYVALLQEAATSFERAVGALKVEYVQNTFAAALLIAFFGAFWYVLYGLSGPKPKRNGFSKLRDHQAALAGSRLRRCWRVLQLFILTLVFLLATYFVFLIGRMPIELGLLERTHTILQSKIQA